MVKRKNNNLVKVSVAVGGGIRANELAENSDSFGLRFIAGLVFEGDFHPVPQSI